MDIRTLAKVAAKKRLKNQNTVVLRIGYYLQQSKGTADWNENGRALCAEGFPLRGKRQIPTFPYKKITLIQLKYQGERYRKKKKPTTITQQAMEYLKKRERPCFKKK